MNDRINFVYIMSEIYSGSTLLSFLLGGHPQIATVGELFVAPNAKTSPEEYLCSCRAPIRECGFWRTVTSTMKTHGESFDVWDADIEFRDRAGGVADVVLRALQRGPVLEAVRSMALRVVPRARREHERLLRRNEALVHSIASVRGCRTFVDASKRPERAVYMQRIRSLDVKVIHLVRDGRAVAWSSMKNLGVGPEQAAASWVATNRASEAARRNFAASRWLTLRYEDLCADPRTTLNRLFDFVGVPARDATAEFRSTEQHIIGNRMRLTTTTDIRADDRWRSALSGDQRERVSRLVGPMNARYGYDRA